MDPDFNLSIVAETSPEHPSSRLVFLPGNPEKPAEGNPEMEITIRGHFVERMADNESANIIEKIMRNANAGKLKLVNVQLNYFWVAEVMGSFLTKESTQRSVILQRCFFGTLRNDDAPWYPINTLDVIEGELSFEMIEFVRKVQPDTIIMKRCTVSREYNGLFAGLLINSHRIKLGAAVAANLNHCLENVLSLLIARKSPVTIILNTENFGYTDETFNMRILFWFVRGINSYILYTNHCSSTPKWAKLYTMKNTNGFDI